MQKGRLSVDVHDILVIELEPGHGIAGFQFGFFCIAGWLGLLGMIIKNVIVLLDEVNIIHPCLSALRRLGGHKC